MRKNIIFILIVIFVSSIFLLKDIKNQHDSDIKYINGMLYNLDIELDILSHAYSNYNEDKYFKKKITHLIVNQLLTLSFIDPPIDELKGVPLKALQRLILFKKNKSVDFSLSSDNSNDYGSQAINSYLDRIDSTVESEIAKRNQMLSNPIKNEIKKKWEQAVPIDSENTSPNSLD